MATGAPHRFRFFIEGDGTPGARFALDDNDVRHVAVVRLVDGDVVDVVDAGGVVWRARLDGSHVVLDSQLDQQEEAQIDLVAGVLVGGRFDELVDAAVQAGVTRIVPLADTMRDAQRIDARRSRLERIARAAAKQSKRTSVPEVADAIDAQQLRDGPIGVVLDAGAPETLDEALLAVAGNTRSVRLLVGPAQGLDTLLLSALVETGWRRGRLGNSVLRSELAAPVAVAIAAMSMTHT